jgi:hypothetical protein
VLPSFLLQAVPPPLDHSAGTSTGQTGSGGESNGVGGSGSISRNGGSGSSGSSDSFSIGSHAGTDSNVSHAGDYLRAFTRNSSPPSMLPVSILPCDLELAPPLHSPLVARYGMVVLRETGGMYGMFAIRETFSSMSTAGGESQHRWQPVLVVASKEGYLHVLRGGGGGGEGG